MPDAEKTNNAVQISPKIRKRQSRTRHRIIHESARLFLQKGFENTSVEDIIEAAEIARSSFYRFFSNREQVLANIIRPVFKQGVTALRSIDTNDPREIMEGIFDTYLALWQSGENELRLSTRIGGVYFYLFQDVHNEYREVLDGLVAKVASSGILLNDSTDYTVRLFARSAVPVLEVYSSEPDLADLFKKTMLGMLLKAGAHA